MLYYLSLPSVSMIVAEEVLSKNLSALKVYKSRYYIRCSLLGILIESN